MVVSLDLDNGEYTAEQTIEAMVLPNPVRAPSLASAVLNPGGLTINVQSHHAG